MKTKKGFVSIEYTIVILLFLIVLITFVAKFNSILPGEVDRIRASTACFEAEKFADALLYFPGNETDWEKGGDFKRLGFGNGSQGLNYTKWVAAQNWTAKNISLKTGTNESFLIKYSAYALTPTSSFLQRFDSQEAPNESAIIFFPNDSTLGVYVRNSRTKALKAEFEFVFPGVGIEINETSHATAYPDSPLETSTGEDKTIILNGTNGSVPNSAIIKLSFFLQNDSDQARFYLNQSFDVVFIKRLDFYHPNATFSRDYPIFLNGTQGISSSESCVLQNCSQFGTLLKDSFGAQGLRVNAASTTCEVKRKMIMSNNTEKFGVDISIIAEG